MTILIGVTLVASVAVPAGVASASSLLSGYGGPGQGDQALLGSALSNGPRGGSGGRNGAVGAAPSEASGGEGIAAAERPSGPEPRFGPGARTGAAAHGSRAHEGAPTRRTGAHGRSLQAAPPAAATAAELYAAAERNAPATSGGTLGLSGADLALIALALVALALVGALSRRLARTPPPIGPHAGDGG